MKRALVLIASLAILAFATTARADITILSGKYLVAAGDIACAPSNSSPTNTACREGETGALFGTGALHTNNMTGLVPLGDEQYSNVSTCSPATICGGVLADFNNSTFACTTQQCGYDKAWGQYTSAIFAVLPTPGDHDYQDNQDGSGCRLNSGGTTPNACGLNGYFGNSVAAPNIHGDSAGDYYFTYDGGAAHPLLVIVVNTGQCFVVNTPCANGGAVVTWLTNTLADTGINPPKDCVVIATADSRWSYYDHGDDAHVGSKLWQAAFSPSTHGQWADLWLSSHDHIYENYTTGIDVNGVKNTGSYDPAGDYLRETVVGTGGHDLAGTGTCPGTGCPGSIPPDSYDATNFGDLQLVYDSSAGTLRSEFFKAYPGTGGEDDTGAWTCRT